MTTFLKAITSSVRYWYVPAIIGVLLILLGGYLFTVPVAAYLTLVMLFSISFLVTGLLEIYFSFSNKDELEGWGWYLTGGIFSTIIGILLMATPQVAAAALPFFVGFSLMFRSFQGIGIAFEMKNYGILDWGNLAIISVIGVIFSFLLIAHPVFTGLSLVVLTALSFIFSGVSGVVMAFQLKKLKSHPAEFKEKIEQLKKEYYSTGGSDIR